MNTIWKFALTNGNSTDIEAPIEKFLTAQMQNDTLCVWAIVDLDKAPRKYRIEIIGTGWECQKIDASKYIGTVQDDGYVWHCFWEEVQTYKDVKEPTFAMFSSRRTRPC